MEAKTKEMSIKEALDRLEVLVKKIEDPTNTLDDVSKEVKEAMSLIELTRNKLRCEEDKMTKMLNFEK